MRGFLESGEQTQLSKIILEHAEKCSSRIHNINNARKAVSCPDPLVKVYNTCDYLKEIANGKKRGSISYDSTVDELISSGVFEEDMPLVFRALMTAQGVPTSVLLGIYGDFSIGREKEPKLFSRVLGSGKSFVVDTSKCSAVAEEYKIIPYVIASEGLDLKDMGFGSDEQVHSFVKKNFSPLVKKYHYNLGTNWLQRFPKME